MDADIARAVMLAVCMFECVSLDVLDDRAFCCKVRIAYCECDVMSGVWSGCGVK